MKLRQSVTQKGKLSQAMRNWLPILQADIESLKEELDKFAKENPFVEQGKKYHNNIRKSQNSRV